MIPRRCRRRLPAAAQVFFVTSLGALLAGGLGCHHTQKRGQAEDEPERDPYEVKTVGDVTDAVANAEPIAVAGVSVVTGLEGTGSSPARDDYRTMLVDQLQKRGVREVDKLLDDPGKETSLVLVTALIPAGARKGDPVDVEVTLPPGSKTASLRGGYLQECPLYSYDTIANLKPDYAGPNKAVKGHVLARAKGPLLVGFGDGDEAAKVRQGRVWGGARSHIDRPFYLVLKGDQQHAVVAARVAQRVNETFHGPFPGAAGGTTAGVRDKTVVEVVVPYQYRHNVPRYLRVVRLIPLREPAEARPAENGAKPPEPGGSYRRQLAEDLLDPARCVSAALRLEALGTDTVPLLKRGLGQEEHVLVRFCAAEALAYLGSPAGGEELAAAAASQPALRAYALTALASLDEAVSRVKLRELLTSTDPETRYGAFRALRTLDENDPAVAGEFLNDSFWLHRVMPETPALVHLSTGRRPELVLFGADACLRPPISFLAGDFVVATGKIDERCTITRRRLNERPLVRQCSLKLEDVVRNLADMGAQYPEVVEVLRQADRCHSLSCPVLVDALPQAASVQELARAGKDAKRKADMTKAGLVSEEGVGPAAEVFNARLELGATPTLFAKPGRRPATDFERDDAAGRDRKPNAGKKAAE